jgi:hypothetical protein
MHSFLDRYMKLKKGYGLLLLVLVLAYVPLCVLGEEEVSGDLVPPSVGGEAFVISRTRAGRFSLLPSLALCLVPFIVALYGLNRTRSSK